MKDKMTPAQQQFLTEVTMAFAKMHRQMLSERIKRGIAEKKKRLSTRKG